MTSSPRSLTAPRRATAPNFIITFCALALPLGLSLEPGPALASPPDAPQPRQGPAAPPDLAPSLDPTVLEAERDPEGPDAPEVDGDAPAEPAASPVTPPEPAPTTAPLDPDDRRVIASLALSLPLHGRPPLALPPRDAPDEAWLAVADTLSLLFSPRRTPKREREALLKHTRPLGPALTALVPTHRRYRALQQALRRARHFPAVAPPIPETSYRLRAGTTAPEIAVLRQRLLREGYGDPNVTGKLEAYFDNRLKRALQRWQRDHGLPRTSVIDPLTRRRLNEDRPHPVAALALALERWRALELRHDDDRTIVVHINTFELFAEERGTTEVRMPVIVGKATDKDATPALSARLEAVITNPRWVVPPRITRDTLRPSVNDDPERLIERGFDVDVLEDGRWRVRMGPGPENPLGRVKFTLVGTSGIYLHDTPGRRAFGQRDRSLSHGCVRVGDAIGLAKWLLPAEGEAIESSLMTPQRSQFFRPQRPFTVHLSYQTLSADEAGELTRHPDIYNLDAEALASVDAAAIIEALRGLLKPDDGPAESESTPHGASL